MVVGDRQATLEDIDPGTEVVVLPVAGTTAMHGTVDLRLEAELVMDFATYRRWKLPKLALDEPAAADDPAAINSSGVESAPVPVGGGTVIATPVIRKLEVIVSSPDVELGADGSCEPRVTVDLPKAGQQMHIREDPVRHDAVTQ